MLVALLGGIRWFMANQDKNELKEATISHVTKKGYGTEKDIEEMSVVNVGENNEKKAVVVTFKDEPKVAYFYSYKNETKQIIQIDVVNKGTNQPLKRQEN